MLGDVNLAIPFHFCLTSAYILTCLFLYANCVHPERPGLILNLHYIIYSLYFAKGFSYLNFFCLFLLFSLSPLPLSLSLLFLSLLMVWYIQAICKSVKKLFVRDGHCQKTPKLFFHCMSTCCEKYPQTWFNCIASYRPALTYSDVHCIELY